MPSAKMANDIPIAVVGLACRFPGDASTPSKFWDMLKEGRDAYSPTSSRWNSDAFYHPNTTRTNVIPTKGGHFLKEDPYVYDAAFFNITATEAVALDPKQRIAMEVTYEALENANLSLQDVWGTQTTCYIGSAVSDYRDSVIRDFMQNPKYHLLGTGEEMISNRISHFLNIHGPSATVATACSSSLMATHMAVQSIKSGEADMAITGGVGLMLTPDFTTHLANLSFLNPAGQSRAFDESAGGYGRGEGCGIIILKRLDKALADGDNIRSVIRATGANSDGYTQGVTMPSLEAQAALIKHVYESHGLDFGSTQYVEAHGTGTKAGDPIEAEAIYSTIGKGASRRGKLWMGSAKPNIGHLEPAAGVASIIKGVLALEHGLIPPNVRFHNPNPAIPFDKWNMAVPTELTPWPMARTKRVSINGFGMGGTNGHVVLEAFNPSPATNGNGTVKLLNGSGPLSKPRSSARLFTFSSYDQAGFKRNSAALAEHLASQGPAASSPEFLANLAHTLSGARSRLSWRATCVADSATELRDYLTTRPGDGATRDTSSSTGAKRIGFVFTGQGAQWARMGVEMLDRPVFSASVSKSTQFLSDMGCTWDPATELLKSQEDGSRLGLPEISQPICSVLQIALVDELRAWGVTPSRVVGHSSGEIAAAYSIGALGHRDAIAAAYFRGVAATKLRIESPDLKLGMMAVGCSRDEADELIAQQSKLNSGGGKATVACVNSPSSVTLSGDVDSLEILRAVLDERKVFARRLKVEMAYHSSHMNKVMDHYLSTISDVEPLPAREDQGTMVSSVTGFEISPEALGPYYWVRNLVSPVLFSDAVKELVSPDDDGEGNTVDLLIEVGPHSALGGPFEQILSHHGIEKVDYDSILTRGKDALKTSLKLASNLFLAGVPLNISQVNGDLHTRQLVDLPPYQWNHTKAFRHETRIQRELMTRQFPNKSLLGAHNAMMDETQHVWRNFIRLDDEPWIRGHTIGSTVLLPAAGMVSMALAAAQQLAEPEKTPRALRLREVSFFAAMALPEDAATEVITTLRPHLVGTSGSSSSAWWEFTISSGVGVEQLRDNCRGLIAIEYKESTSPQMAHENAELEIARITDFHRIVKECPDTLSKTEFYAQCAKISWNYGELFQGVEKVHLGDGQTAYDVKLADIGETYSRGLERPFLIHGAALDAIIHGALGGTYKNKTFQQDKPLLPTYIGEMEISLDIPDNVGYVLPTSCVSKKLGFNALSSNIVSFDDTVSKTFLSMTDFRLTELGNDDKQDDGRIEVDPAEITSEVRWNYALEVMKPDEIAKVVSAAAMEERAVELLHMLIHDNPAATVIELVSDSEALPNATVSRLPKGTILPSQVRYAVAAGVNADLDKSSLFGDAFSLGGVDEALPADITSADLLVVPQSVSTLGNLEKVLARLAGLSKPDAAIILSVGAKAGPALEAKGFRPVFGVEGAALYKQQPEQQSNGVNGVNGTPSSTRDFIVIEPTTPSNPIKSFSSALQKALRDENHSSAAMSWADLSIQGASETEGKTFISLVELENPLLDNLSEPDFDKVKKLVSTSERLLWVTGGDNPSMAVIDGLSRTARNENASLKFQVMHLSSPDTALRHGPSLATRLMTCDTKDDEFREQDGLLTVSRFFNSVEGNKAVRYCLEDSVRVQPLKENNDTDAPEALRLTIGKPGLLDSLAFIHDERFDAPLGEMEIELDVKATGVNFKDVMASMGLVEVSLIGHEASGTIVAVGSKAAGRFQLGDRVVVSGEGMHATRLRSDHRLSVKIPDTMSFEEAAVLPTVHATAYHALVNVAKLRPGQSVLIHAAAGGVGQAALQLAKHLGLVAYVTVGSEDKRTLVMEKYGVPATHIFNSRDASFVKAIKRVTSGRGVDCVLNSLSGELLRASWECVAMFGTFVEIGLRDITNNMRLDMRPFIKCTTFAFINLTNFFDDHKDIAGQILQDTFDLVHKGVLYAPSPLTAYPVGEIESAFRTMQRGKHRGKLALSFPDGAQAKVYRRAKDALKLDSRATYLIVGGLGGLGRSLAREFVACGAQHIAFISRSGAASAEAREVVEELSARGALVRTYRADVADEASFLAAMEQCSRELPPIRGVVQMAMVLRDSVIENMSYADWSVPLRPKVQGTWNLHRFFDQSRPLDFFIACSSVSGVCGNAGQAQYAAGNTYQDALAAYRRERGLKAVAVNLGIMRDVGAIAESAGVGNNLSQWEDVIGIREPAFHALIKSLIARQRDGDNAAADQCPTQVCTGLGSADLIAAHGLSLPYYFADPRLGPLAVRTSVATQSSADGQGAGASLASRLAEAGGNPEQATEVILDALVHKIADMLQIPASEVDPSRPMYRYGVDSLVALEVRNWITRELKANIALLEILAAVPMATFAGKIAEKSKLVAGSE